jgi:hypothetical protein
MPVKSKGMPNCIQTCAIIHAEGMLASVPACMPFGIFGMQKIWLKNYYFGMPFGTLFGMISDIEIP